ncbi:hypothetical protein VNO78_33602 [Psophocarpus tetragonolobus]|uniref:DYW domain-containing protein n=1 Tax=Psophocarpus tetragonolobus TaxID=3891 RepID=A0AAN9RSA3_PSOTE
MSSLTTPLSMSMLNPPLSASPIRCLMKFPSETVSLTTPLLLYADRGECGPMLRLFGEVRSLGLGLDGLTLSGVITACGDDVGLVRQLHCFVAFLNDARRVFREMGESEGRDEVLWNPMIMACGKHREELEAVGLFREMVKRGFKVDMFTIASVLTAFTCVGGMQSHGMMIKSGLHGNSHVGNGLVDLYSKCAGGMVHALAIKSDIPYNCVSVNNALVAMFSKCGNVHDARRVELPRLFELMLQKDVAPNSITFVSVLSACAHWKNLLGRASRLEEAERIIETMPFIPGSIEWATSLSACRKHGNVELAVNAANEFLWQEPCNVFHYVMLSNMYVSAARWEEPTTVKRLMRDREVKKKPGCSWMEMNKVYAFVAEDTSHPMIKEVEADEKERLLYHSEKLAGAFGLISTEKGVIATLPSNIFLASLAGKSLIEMLTDFIALRKGTVHARTIGDRNKQYCFFLGK